MYFQSEEDRAILQAKVDTRFVLSLNGLAVLAIGLMSGWRLSLCMRVLG
jgi:NADH-quinone oxidoreductase subunit N